MRIIGGIWANRQLVSPSGRVRPTAEAIREAMIGMLAPGDIKGARVLDLFAGTGALGLEALSRGAKRCDFIENGPAAIHALKANVAALRQTKWTRVFDRDAIPFVERLPVDAYDIAFADPPYGSMKLNRVVARWKEVPFSRILLLEHSPDHPDLPRGITKTFGDSAVTMLRTAGTHDSQ
jgi:16S rRNA (guanine966-N2)-methyltransferase